MPASTRPGLFTIYIKSKININICTVHAFICTLMSGTPMNRLNIKYILTKLGPVFMTPLTPPPPRVQNDVASTLNQRWKLPLPR